MIEWNTPVAILCSTNPRDSAAFEIPSILRADPKTSHIPVIGIGDRGQQSQLEALRRGYEDLVDRRLGAEEIAAHLVSILSSRRDGFRPTQMLDRSETALDGRLSLVDLPGVIQVLSQSRQTGGLHINADGTDGIIFFDAGEVIHAESGPLAGDEAIIQLVKSCYLTKDGVYKFTPGDPASLRTVHGSLNALILDALRELDEQEQTSSTQPEDEPTPAPGDQQNEHGATEEELPAGETHRNDSPTEPGPQDCGEPAGQGEVQPETGIPVEVGTTTARTIGEDVACEVVGQPSNTATKDNSEPFLEKPLLESIIGEDALGELNKLLSSLRVEEEGSHE
jgi:hypothetical protein